MKQNDSFDVVDRTSVNGETVDTTGGPDGGYGWVVAACVFGAMFATFGIVLSWGVFLDYFQREIFGMEASFRLSFVGTLILFHITIGAIFIRFIEFVISMRTAFMLGGLLVSGGLAAAGSATEVWQIVLAFGVSVALGNSMIYCTGARIVLPWFTRRRSIAMSFIASSGGLGGLVVPFIVQGIIQKLGGPWMFRILSIAWFIIFATAFALIKEHEQSKQKPIGIKDIFAWYLFKNASFSLWCVAGCLQFLYNFLVPFTLPAYATYIGLSAEQGSRIVSVAMGCSFVGRLGAGVVASRIGDVNCNCICAAMTALSIFLLWMLAHSYGTLLAYACLYGFFGTSYYVFAGPITVVTLGLDNYASGFALSTLAGIPAVVSPTVTSAIDRAVDTEPYFWYKLIPGVAAVISCCLLLLIRYRLAPRQLFAKI